MIKLLLTEIACKQKEYRLNNFMLHNIKYLSCFLCLIKHVTRVCKHTKTALMSFGVIWLNIFFLQNPFICLILDARVCFRFASNKNRANIILSSQITGTVFNQILMYLCLLVFEFIRFRVCSSLVTSNVSI